MTDKPAHIPFNKPYLAGNEIDYLRQAALGPKISGDGAFTRRCRDDLERRLPGSRVLLTTSCTHALDMSAILLDLAPGDEVIVPSFTFVSTVNALVLRGAKPCFVDIRPDTCNLDETLIEAAITPRTKAIYVVHYAGVCCAMDPILAIAGKHGLPVVEDAAHAIGSAYRQRPAGALGAMASFSFHETKNIMCGEGGALAINDIRYMDRAEIIREKGTNRSQFFRGQVDKYTWVDLGSSYLMSDLLAAFLWAQLEHLDDINRHRMAVCARYREAFSDHAKKGLCTLPTVPEDCRDNGHMFYLLLPTGEGRDRMLKGLKDADIMGTFHYVPLHSAPMGQRFGYREGDLPVTEDISARLLRLPLYNSITPAEVDRVIEVTGRLLAGG